MAKIQNVEKAKYIEFNIGIYAKNKVGQYSKFLDKNPIFVTYYHIAQPLSRTDVGTGGIESELGARSPIRFNKILDFPLYNIPELRPDVVFDETGYDIDLDLSDIVVLPNTIKPVPGDYFIVSFPGIKEYLFRVNEIRYNTIQSNDFYNISCDIKDIGKDIEDKRMTGQIVDEYQTVFDNIGTEDRCFVKTTDISYLNSISDLYMKLREYYMNAFYKRDLNTFTFNLGYDCSGSGAWVNDPYLEKFINAAKIYFDEGEDTALVLSLNAFKPKNFELNFSRSLYDAVLRNSLEMLCRYPYAYFISDKDRFSTYAHYGYHAMVPELLMKKDSLTPKPIVPDPIPEEPDPVDPSVDPEDPIDPPIEDNPEYTETTEPETPTTESEDTPESETPEDPADPTEPVEGVTEDESIDHTGDPSDSDNRNPVYPPLDGNLIKHSDPKDEDYKTEIDKLTVDNVEIDNMQGTYEVPWFSIFNTPKWLPTWTCTAQYMSHDFIAQILDGTIETDDYCELIIFNYLHGIAMEYDRSLIIEELEESFHNFYYLPLVIYILGQQYQQYFHKDRAFEL